MRNLTQRVETLSIHGQRGRNPSSSGSDNDVVSQTLLMLPILKKLKLLGEEKDETT